MGEQEVFDIKELENSDTSFEVEVENVQETEAKFEEMTQNEIYLENLEVPKIELESTQQIEDQVDEIESRGDESEDIVILFKQQGEFEVDEMEFEDNFEME